MKRPLLHTTAVLVALLLAGCVSTGDRFEKARTLEAEGRYAEAADYYIKVLDSEPSWESARVRLRDVGARAIEQYLAEAEAAEQRDAYDDAYRLLNRIDDLRDDADDVGVALAVPADYDAYRARIVDAAIDAQLRRGEAAEAAGDWSEALQAFERADDYTNDPALEAAFAEHQARVYLKWGETDAEHDTYRAAFERVQHTIDLVGPEHPLAREAVNLQQATLDAGTHYVAFLPFWRTEEVARTTPETLVQDLNDVLLHDYWAEPPFFIASADAVQLRRELRRLHYDRRVITVRQAAEMGRVVEADFVVVGEVTGFEREERDVKDKPRTARLKGRGSTVTGPKEVEWIERRARLVLEAQIEYRLIDPYTRREVDRGTVSADASGRVRWGVYDGDYRDLDLSGSELSLFEGAEPQAVHEVMNNLVDDLAEELAEHVYRDLLRRIP